MVVFFLFAERDCHVGSNQKVGKMLILIFLVLGIYIGAQLNKGEEQALFPPVINQKKGRHSKNKRKIESETQEESKEVWKVKPVALTKKAIDTLAVKPSKAEPARMANKSLQDHTTQAQKPAEVIYEDPSSIAQEKIVNEDGEFQTFEQYNRPTRKELRQEEHYQKFEKHDAPLEKAEEVPVAQNNSSHSEGNKAEKLNSEWDSLNDNFENIFN